MDYKDYYKVLGVPKTAGQAEIKKAFRKLAREHHPDVKQGDKTAERRFKEINEANAVLSDPAKRKQYDTLGADWESYARAGAAGHGAAGSPFGGSGGAGGGGNVRYEFRTGGDAGGFSDFFRTFFGGASGSAGGASGRMADDDDQAVPRRGSSRTQTVSGASFEDILNEMGFDAAGSTAAGPGARGASRTAGRSAGSVEATAELTLEEAFHGTSRLVEVDGKRLEVTIPTPRLN